MAVQPICDVCKKPCNEIVAKAFLGPRFKTGKHAYHSSYTHHMDIGNCCYERLLKGFNWHARMSAEEYHASRRRKPSVAAGEGNS